MSRAFQASLPLSRSAIDRDHAARTDAALLEELWADDRARVIVLNRGTALAAESLIRADESTPRAALRMLATADLPAGLWRADAEAAPSDSAAAEGTLSASASASAAGSPAAGDSGEGAAADERVPAVRLYLGREITAPGATAGSPWFALIVDDTAAASFGGASWLDLRRIAVQLDDLGAGVFTEALAMANWHAVHRFCPRCGSATRVESAGWVRRCLREDVELFPRTDAAVIVGIVDTEERLLLGSNALWENNRYSLLAGFVEPGESLEAAAVREVAEESGVLIRDPEYVGSQPWPFPASLMVGFMATASDDDRAGLAPDGDEILSLRWFSRAEIADPATGVLLPGRSSIARAIVERWYGGPLPEHHGA